MRKSSISVLAPRRRAVVPLFLGPVQHALLDDVKEARQDQDDEQEHLDKGKHLQVAVHDSPRIEEDRFDVEQDEDHRDQVEPYAEALLGGAGRGDAAFVRQILYWISGAFAKSEGQRDQRGCDHYSQNALQQDREVHLRIGSWHYSLLTRLRMS